MTTHYVIERHNGITSYTPCKDVHDANRLFEKIFDAGGEVRIISAEAIGKQAEYPDEAVENGMVGFLSRSEPYRNHART